MHSRIRGLVAAPFTPFRADGSLNLDAIPAYAALLRDNQVRAAFVCGTTGEGLSMTLAERMAVAERWKQVATERLAVIVHVGHTCLEDARTLAAHAQKIGATAISTIAPCFFKSRNNDELVAWCGAIAAAAPGLPFYYYHIPSMTGVALPVAEFLAKADGRIPSLVGVKFTFEDLPDYAASVRYGDGKYDVLFGRDELLLEGLENGAHGAVGSTYNYAAPLYLRLMEALRAGDRARARALQDAAIRMIATCSGAGVTHLAATKALMATVGVDCGPVRLPLQALSVERLAKLRRDLGADGFAEFCCAAGGRK